MFPWFLYHFLWFLSCIFPCFCSHFLRFYNMFYAASQLFPIFSVVRTWLASPLLSVRLVTRATCILVIAIDNNRYESCQSNSRVIGCSIWRLSKTTQTYILWFSDFESKSLLLLNFWPPLFFEKKGCQNAHFLSISYFKIEKKTTIQLLGTLLEYTSWLHRTTPTKHLVPVHSRNIATRLK